MSGFFSFSRIFFEANIPHFSPRNSKTKYFLPSFSIHSHRYSCECVCRIIKLTITDSDKNVYNNSLHSHIWHISHFVGDTYTHNCCRARCLKISIQLCCVYPKANEFYINWRKIVGNCCRMEHPRMEILDICVFSYCFTYQGSIAILGLKFFFRKSIHLCVWNLD